MIRFLPSLFGSATYSFWAMGLLAGPALAVDLPVPCVAGGCGAIAPSFVSQGSASAVLSGNTLNVTQTSGSAILNWKSFNVSKDGTVNFLQPDASSIALNRIFQADPSRIAGALNSNGRIYLLNQNGIVFADGAQINVGGLLASSLDFSPQALQSGLALAASQNAPALQPFVDANGNPVLGGAVRVESGATINSSKGQVFLFAPEVSNAGSIATPDGQTILAAGQRVFLLASSDPNLRGLFVEVGDGGTVTNGQTLTGAASSTVAKISADRGNVTLAGAIVRQAGTVSATTSVRANGSIRLQARDTAERQLGSANVLQAERGGALELTANSNTSVTLDTNSTETTVDVNTQPQSSVDLIGKKIRIDSGAQVRATAGRITALAAASPTPAFSPQQLTSTPDDSVLSIADGAVLDVSGATLALAMERNSLRVELRGSQLADSPLQREGPLRSQPVYVDVRNYGTRADGSTWQGTPLADVSGDISNIRRSVQERSLNAGTIQLQSQGAVLVGQGATLDVSGGQIDWQSGYVRSSQLRGTDGKLYDISTADPNRTYVGIEDAQTITDQRWGVTRQVSVQGFSTLGRYEAGYVEGRNAGSVSVLAPLAALDGKIVGTTTRGPLQRRDPNLAFTNSGSVIGSLSDVIARAASLQIGSSAPRNLSLPDYLATDIDIAPGLVLGTAFAGSDGAELPASLTRIRVRPDLFGPDGVQNLNAFANGTIRVAPDVDLSLPAGGSVALTAGKIDIQSSISAPSGSISALARQTNDFTGADESTTPGLRVAPGVSLLATGGWVNDGLDADSGTMPAPLFINGGGVSLSASNGSVEIGSGGVIDVSGGGQLTASGAVVAGRAGSITLSTSTGDAASPTALSLGKTLQGYALAGGGSLSLLANSICISASSCSKDASQVELTPDWFIEGGFGRISLATSIGSLEVLGDASVQLRQRNFILLDSSVRARTGTAMSDLSRIGLLPDFQRRAMNLSLTAAFQPTQFEFADLLFDRGARIIADPLAQINLTSNSRIFFDGSVSAPGGAVNLVLNNSAKTTFISSQGIWIGANARLDVAGQALYQPSKSNPTALTGSVLDGGSIRVSAQRGYIFADPGSVLDASGTQAPIDVPNGFGLYERQYLGSNGGSIALFAAEGMQLDGELLARSAGLPGNAGGSLSVTLDATQRKGDPTNGYPVGDRTVLVSAASVPVIVAPGTDVPAFLNGVARISAGTIAHGGFDTVSLAARHIYVTDPVTSEQQRAGSGRVFFESGVSIAPHARLAIDAPVIGVLGSGSASLSAAYVSLGTGDLLSQEVDAASGGAGKLAVNADFIDLIGNISLANLSQTRLDAAGDIRARGVFSLSAADYLGTLRAADQLTLSARQIYPSTLSNYSIDVSGLTGTLSTLQAPGAAADVLSAGGKLSLSASHIIHGGTLRAPLGQLTLKAPQIDALSGSILSTSLEGKTVPFGQTQGGLDWVYVLDQGTRVYGATGSALPSQNISLQGETINLAAGSKINVSGGGDLLAYEFIKGPGGTQDILDPSIRPNQFAIVPSLNLTYAPFDPHESIGSTLRPGDQIALSGGGGLAAGVYTLLPARYALLPGAFLVSSVSGYQDLAPGQTTPVLGGGIIVSGRTAIAGTDILSARTSGFIIRPGTVALTEAKYTTSKATEFFGSGAGRSAAGASFALPNDAGSVSLIASRLFTLDATLNAAVASTGRGASLELSSDKLIITDDPAAALPGYVAVSVDRLASFGAQTVLLGGQQRQTGTGPVIDVTASAVEVAANTQLTGANVILVAKDSLKLDDGATVSSSGAFSGSQPKTIGLDTNSSLLRVSSGPQVTVERGAAGSGAGLVEFAQGSTISSGGSVLVDAGISADSKVVFDVTGALSLSAPKIAIGTAPADFSGIVYDPAAAQTSKVSSRVLNGRSSIDLFAGADLSGGDVTLSTPLLQAASASVTARLQADTLHLVGAKQSAAPVTGLNSGELTIHAKEIDAGGNMVIDGFETTSVSADKTFRPSDSGSLLTDGDLSLAAAWLTTGSGVDYAIHSNADVSLRALPAAGLAQPTNDLGGRLAISAQRISGEARISVPAGQIALTANGAGADLSLGGATVLDAAGRAKVFDQLTLGANGGTITLEADSGGVTLASGSQVDVSGGGGNASAGTLRLLAPQSTVNLSGAARGGAAANAHGANVQITARALDFAATKSTLASGGFTGDWNVRLTGPGDLNIDAADSLRVSSLRLTADAGAIDIAGKVNASSPRGGYVGLSASGPITVSGSIDARATDANVSGGRVELFSATSIGLGSQSTIDVGGTALADPAAAPGGRVYLRLPRTSISTLLDGDAGNDALRLDGRILGGRQVSIEGYETYALADGQIGSANTLADLSNPWFSEAQNFQNGAATILAALGHSSDASYALVSGLEITSAGDMHLASDWNLYDWRFAGQPGALTLRAGGDLYVDHSLSDGFASINQDLSSFQLPSQAGPSWSYRLAAGADLTAANPLVTSDQAAANDTGSVKLAPGQSFAGGFGIGAPVMIRTGTGRIDIAAASDVVFGNQASVIYTAGIAGPGVTIGNDQSVGGLNNLAYPTNGGDISLAAGRDVIGPQSRELFTDWLWRSGGAFATVPTTTAWTVAFDRFEQGIAALGGGNVVVSAGRDVIDVAAATPSIGRQVGGVDPAQNRYIVTGGGDLNVTAGRDLLGGTFYSDVGVSRIFAQDRIGASASLTGGNDLAPVLALGAGMLRADAVRGLSIATVVNPTLIDVSLTLDPGDRTYFSTYTDRSAVSLSSIAGQLDFRTDQSLLLNRFPDYPSFSPRNLTALQVLPPNLDATAFTGSLRIGGSMSLWPSPTGNLRLLAGENVALELFTKTGALDILVSDAAITSLPTPARPASTLDDVVALLSSATPSDLRFNAATPVHNSPATGLDDNPVLIVAAHGDVTMQTEFAGKQGLLYAPKPLRVVAGRDIVNFTAQIQNLTANDVSSLIAGRDFAYLIGRSQSGGVLAARGGVTVDGPGRLEVIAGGDVNLQASSGLVTQGQLRNRALPDKGADISVLAGLAGNDPDYDAFIDRYLQKGSLYDKALIEYMTRESGAAPAGKAAALGGFKLLSRTDQRALLENILFDELKAGGRVAAQAGLGNGDYTRSFLALETLFPGSNPDSAKGEKNRYAGDIRLFFSRIYTLDGGDIDLLAPGGEVNVGLATPPSAFGLGKKPSELGLVAQSTGSLNSVSYSNFQVNESRAFASDGGNILVWSTAADIDAGRGAKTAISAPPPTITVDSQGQVNVVFPAALSGSGIQTLATSAGREPGDVDLYAPRGVVNAGDAGIVAGNLTIGATAVLGANNITVSGTSVGVPVDTGGLGASLAGAASTAAGASNAAQDSLGAGEQKKESPLADNAMTWLDVFVTGLGEENCKPDDAECLKRQKR